MDNGYNGYNNEKGGQVPLKKGGRNNVQHSVLDNYLKLYTSRGKGRLFKKIVYTINKYMNEVSILKKQEGGGD